MFISFMFRKYANVTKYNITLTKCNIVMKSVLLGAAEREICLENHFLED